MTGLGDTWSVPLPSAVGVLKPQQTPLFTFEMCHAIKLRLTTCFQRPSGWSALFRNLMQGALLHMLAVRSPHHMARINMIETFMLGVFIPCSRKDGPSFELVH